MRLSQSSKYCTRNALTLRDKPTSQRFTSFADYQDSYLTSLIAQQPNYGILPLKCYDSVWLDNLSLVKSSVASWTQTDEVGVETESNNKHSRKSEKSLLKNTNGADKPVQLAQHGAARQWQPKLQVHALQFNNVTEPKRSANGAEAKQSLSPVFQYGQQVNEASKKPESCMGSDASKSDLDYLEVYQLDCAAGQVGVAGVSNDLELNWDGFDGPSRSATSTAEGGEQCDGPEKQDSKSRRRETDVFMCNNVNQGRQLEVQGVDARNTQAASDAGTMEATVHKADLSSSSDTASYRDYAQEKQEYENSKGISDPAAVRSEHSGRQAVDTVLRPSKSLEHQSVEQEAQSRGNDEQMPSRGLVRANSAGSAQAVVGNNSLDDYLIGQKMGLTSQSNEQLAELLESLTKYNNSTALSNDKLRQRLFEIVEDSKRASTISPIDSKLVSSLIQDESLDLPNCGEIRCKSFQRQRCSKTGGVPQEQVEANQPPEGQILSAVRTAAWQADALAESAGEIAIQESIARKQLPVVAPAQPRKPNSRLRANAGETPQNAKQQPDRPPAQAAQQGNALAQQQESPQGQGAQHWATDRLFPQADEQQGKDAKWHPQPNFQPASQFEANSQEGGRKNANNETLTSKLTQMRTETGKQVPSMEYSQGDRSQGRDAGEQQPGRGECNGAAAGSTKWHEPRNSKLKQSHRPLNADIYGQRDRILQLPSEKLNEMRAKSLYQINSELISFENELNQPSAADGSQLSVSRREQLDNDTPVQLQGIARASTQFRGEGAQWDAQGSSPKPAAAQHDDGALSEPGARQQRKGEAAALPPQRPALVDSGTDPAEQNLQLSQSKDEYIQSEAPRGPSCADFMLVVERVLREKRQPLAQFRRSQEGDRVSALLRQFQ